MVTCEIERPPNSYSCLVSSNSSTFWLCCESLPLGSAVDPARSDCSEGGATSGVRMGPSQIIEISLALVSGDTNVCCGDLEADIGIFRVCVGKVRVCIGVFTVCNGKFRVCIGVFEVCNGKFRMCIGASRFATVSFGCASASSRFATASFRCASG